MKPLLTDYTLAELEDLFGQLGEPAFRARQVYGFLQKGLGFEGMANIGKALREKLEANAAAQGASICKTLVSPLDGTEKYLFALRDGNIVEGVFMRYHYGNTLCISTQVGCRMGCAFCASTLEGCVRDLSPGEMLSEVLTVDALHRQGDKRGVTNVVLMGSGEPLDNYANVLKFLRLLSAPEGICISLRNVSLSTCGLVDGIDRLAEENLGLTLSISLHAPTNEQRSALMPVNRRWSLEQLLPACKRYEQRTGRRIVFEYALIEGKNTDLRDAERLAALVRGLRCHVNLIPVNLVKERGLHPPKQAGIEAFEQRLKELHVSVTRRREMGDDIGGACGQLRRSHLEQSAKNGSPTP